MNDEHPFKALDALSPPEMETVLRVLDLLDSLGEHRPKVLRALARHYRDDVSRWNERIQVVVPPLWDKHRCGSAEELT